MTYRHKNGRCNKPSPAIVHAVAAEEAEKAGAILSEALGASNRRCAVKARKQAWARILTETQCSMNGLATVWGCERQAIRRGVASLQDREAA